jgi:hypothetical protein
MRKFLPILLVLSVTGCATLAGLWQGSASDHVGIWDAPDQTLILSNEQMFTWTVDDSTQAPRSQVGGYMVGSTEIVFIVGPNPDSNFAITYTLFKDSLTLGVGPEAVIFTRRTAE